MPICQVNLANIAANFKKFGPCIPVIKSNAYGLGLIPVAKTLASAGCRAAACGSHSEAAQIHSAGLNLKIITLIEPVYNPLPNELPCVWSFGYLESLIQSGHACEIALKLDCGMSRLGLSPEEIYSAAYYIKANPQLKPRYLICHPPCPEDQNITAGQLETIRQCFGLLKDSFPNIELSCGASHGPHCGMPRPGLFIYGGAPGSLPILSLRGEIISTRVLEKGSGVSYGWLYKAKEKTKISVINLGYANGIPRSLSNRLKVYIGGEAHAQIGAICMNLLMIEGGELNQEAEILGGGNAIDSLSALAGVSPYELLLNIASLNEKEYI